MNDRPRSRSLTWLAVVPAATVAWLGLGTGVALAAPGDHGSAVATTANPNANSGANLGVGNGNGNGNAKHDPTTPDLPATTPTDTSTSAGTATSGADHSSGNAGTAGDPTKTQPVSTADSKGGGANGQCLGGPYCSTRDRSPSGNGNGTGKAVGKPCAGCVGKADNKNPKGQMPGGSDHNAGYECDRNHGIGRSNPAHTGCTSSNPPPSCVAPSTMVGGVCTPPCPTGQTRVNGVCTPVTSSCFEGEHLVAGVCLPDDDCVPTAANHNCTPTTPCVAPAHAGPDGTCVLGEKFTRKPGTPTTTVLGTKVTRLPFTGASVGWMVEGGLAAITTGTLALVAGGRRRRQLG